MRRATGFLIQGALALALIVGALLVEWWSGRLPQPRSLAVLAPFQGGWYGQEQSTSLPGDRGPLERTYYWTRPESSLTLWPAPAGAAILAVEYLNPSSEPAVLQLGSHVLHLAPQPALRRMRLLLPSSNDGRIALRVAPTDHEGRQLGLLLSDVRWRGVAATTEAPGRALLLAAGTPLTIVLVLVLLGLIGVPPLPRIMLAAALLAGFALLAAVHPWELRAMQPALQALGLFALAGVAIWHAARRMRIGRGERVLIAAWAASTLIFFGPAISHDGSEYYAYVRSLFVDGDLRFDNELDPAQSPFEGTPDFARMRTETGYVPNLASVGPALAWTPFWLLAHVLALLGQGLGLPWRPDGYAPPYVVLVTLASALAGLGTMLGSYKLARRWFPASIATLASITVYFGSNLLFYAQIGGSFAHSLSAATTTWLVVAALVLDDAPSRRGWILLGAAAGATVVTYWIAALLLVIPALVVARHVVAELRERSWHKLGELTTGSLWAAGTALLVFAPQMFAWRIIDGQWLGPSRAEGALEPSVQKLAMVFFSSLYGLTWWTPAYVLGLVGLAVFAVRRPWPGLILALGLGLYLLYNASIGDWDGGGAFGLRRLTALAPLCAIGIAALLDPLRRIPALPFVLAAMTSGWGIQMMVRYLTYDLPHELWQLQDMGLRALLLRPVPIPTPLYRAVVREGWFGLFLRAPSIGDSLILLVALLVVALVVRGWRRGHQRLVPVTPYV